MLRLDKPEDRAFTLRLEETEKEIHLTCDGAILLAINKHTQEIYRVGCVGSNLGFELDKDDRVVVK